MELGKQTKREKALRDLYGSGPLSLGSQSLKTVKAYVSRARLSHNVHQIKAIIGPKVNLCAVVKANAYGHSATDVVMTIRDEVDSFAVSTIEEAAQIAPHVHDKSILITCPLFASIEPQLVRLAQARGFHCTVCTFSALDYLEKCLDPTLPPLNIHLKVDTGMGRIGCFNDEIGLLIQFVRQSPLFKLSGIYTHFATADDTDLSFVDEQLAEYRKILAMTGLDNDPTVIKHTCNTSASLRIPDARFDMVRCGLGLYGYYDADNHLEKPINLKPVMHLEAPLVLVKDVKLGQSFGYGRTTVAKKDMTVGVVPVGYADGLFRALSNKAVMCYGEYRLPILGRVSMDLTIVDLTDFPQAREGLMIRVIDDHIQSPCNAVSLAKLADTIPYEILVAIGNRVKREFVD